MKIIVLVLVILLSVFIVSISLQNNHSCNCNLKEDNETFNDNIKENFTKEKNITIDHSLQYNLTNHDVRNKILNHYADNAPESPKKADIEDMRTKVRSWYDTSSKNGTLKSMDYWGMICIESALDSVSIGNWGIGNVLCWAPPGMENDPTKWIELVRGGNRFFARNLKNPMSVEEPITTRLDSHAHGEMMVLDDFEEKLSMGCYDKSSPNYCMPKESPVDFRKRNDLVGYGIPDNIILFTQLNSCQMCLSRIGNSGISRCYWMGPDTAGGMAHRLCDSVPAYFNMLNRQVHGIADVSTDIIKFAFDAFAGPDAKWVIYCTWKLNQVAAPGNAKADYGYCKGQWYANNKVGQNAVWDWGGWYRTVDMTDGPKLACTVTDN